MSKQIRSLRLLEEETGARVGEWLRRCNSKGVAVLVYETLRLNERQAELYRVGRDSNGVRITGEKVVTMAKPGYSWHNFGRAIDAVPWEWYVGAGRPTAERKLDWSPFETGADRRAWPGALRTVDGGDLTLLDPRWRVMVEQADRAGLEWSGRWTRFREYVHFQHRGGHTLEELREAS